MTTSSTIEDFVSRILLVMRYFPSSSDRFFCHRSIADCMLGGHKYNTYNNSISNLNISFLPIPSGITETSTSVSSTSSVAIPLPTCLPSSSQSAAANTMVAILHDYTNSQVRNGSTNMVIVQNAILITVRGFTSQMQLLTIHCHVGPLLDM